MTRLSIARPKTHAQASAMMTDGRYELPVLKAGGIDVIDHMKEGLVEPDLLVDVRPLGRGGRDGIIGWADAGRRELRLEAGATLAEIASSELLREQVPALGQAAASSATPQIRNVATVAGNLLQRPRCWYYRNEHFDCLKKGGARCFAFDGENKFHAIFGEGPCYIVHPSSLAPVLAVCGGRVHLTGGERDALGMDELYHMPEDGLHDEHNLRPGELVTRITLESAPASGFYVIKEKQSFDWPLVLAAVALELKGATIASARVCAGAVAPVPWMLPGVEEALEGVSLDDDRGLRAACAESVRGASALSDNAYKLRLLPVAVRRAVLRAGGRPVEEA